MDVGNGLPTSAVVKQRGADVSVVRMDVKEATRNQEVHQLPEDDTRIDTHGYQETGKHSQEKLRKTENECNIFTSIVFQVLVTLATMN